MGLGRWILRSMFHKPNRRRNNSTLDNVVGVALGVAAVTAVRKMQQEAGGGPIIPEIINHAMDLKAQDANKPQTESGATLATEKRFNTLMAKLAVCYYIAGIDGDVTEDEKRELAEAYNMIMNDTTIPSTLKEKVKEVTDPGIAFVKVQQYLDKAESAALISFAYEIEELAKKGGLSPKEEDAVEMYKYYVTEKTGHKFIKLKEDLEQMPVQVDLTCPSCGGQMELDRTMLKATCIYCGTNKIIDANQIQEVVAQIERSKRLGL
ncbi:MAG: hypothetical protein K6F49_06005 [Saccharofermentans sp.]|nr:hypothetical protein [Saccharofermentans sp.]